MLALQRLFEADYRDGTLEQMALSPIAMPLLLGAKMLAHWLVSGLPLVLLAPVLGLQFDLSGDALVTLTLALFLGTPILSLVGGIGAALTLGVRGGGVLLSLLVLPLFVPVLVFGAGAVEAQVSGLGAQAHLSILMAMLLPAVFLGLWLAQWRCASRWNNRFMNFFAPVFGFTTRHRKPFMVWPDAYGHGVLHWRSFWACGACGWALWWHQLMRNKVRVTALFLCMCLHLGCLWLSI
jgi:heme exporter protein CcmB